MNFYLRPLWGASWAELAGFGHQASPSPMSHQPRQGMDWLSSVCWLLPPQPTAGPVSAAPSQGWGPATLSATACPCCWGLVSTVLRSSWSGGWICSCVFFYWMSVISVRYLEVKILPACYSMSPCCVSPPSFIYLFFLNSSQELCLTPEFSCE